jgi:hypothetical protein
MLISRHLTPVATYSNQCYKNQCKRSTARVTDIDNASKSREPLETVPGAVHLERQMAEWRQAALAGLPSHLRSLAKLVRRSVATGRLNALDRWCKRRGLVVRRSRLRAFRDYLITRLLELKDLEPAARARLRRDALATEDERQMTDDYRRGVQAGDDLRCRDCRYFVTAPSDGDRTDASADKPRVALGTKGADLACFGFTRAETR